MKAAPIPQDDERRLAVLDEHHVVDTAPEDSFDALTKLAAHVVGTPIALVSIVTKDRQWFKSKVGLDADQTSRDISFCGHVVASGQPLIVADALGDERFFDNPLVLGYPRLRFYAGMPLRSQDGFTLGTLCVIDQQPRELSDAAAELLKLIAVQASAQLELRRKDHFLAQDRDCLRESEARLRCSLSEKETLLQEVHHRVKNNLQVIASLLNLQAKHLDEGARAAFLATRQRVQAIALLHQDLYRSPDLAAIHMKAYLRSVGEDLLSVAGNPERSVDIAWEVEDLSANMDTAVPLGLIVNELISNAIEHAFTGRDRGQMNVALAADGDSWELRVSDDGMGMPRGFNFGHESTLGLRLVSNLARQLDGDLSLLPNGGTSWRLRFPHS